MTRDQAQAKIKLIVDSTPDETDLWDRETGNPVITLYTWRRILTPMSFDEIADLVNTYRAKAPERARIKDQSINWLYDSVAVGVSKTKLGYGDNFRRMVEENWDGALSGSEAGRYARIYKEILSPRLKEYMKEAQFPLIPRGYYVAACEYARKLDIDALHLLELAESKTEEGNPFSVTEFREILQARLSARKLRALRDPEDHDFSTAWEHGVDGPEGDPCNIPGCAETHGVAILPSFPGKEVALEWALVSVMPETEGIYMAARGKSEAVVGYHQSEVSQQRDVLLDGEHVTAEEAWKSLKTVAKQDGLCLPRTLIFPDINGQFVHRPDASGQMELLVLPLQLSGEVVGLIFIDYTQREDLLLRNQQSYSYLRSVTQELVDHLSARKAEIFAGDRLRW